MVGGARIAVFCLALLVMAGGALACAAPPPVGESRGEAVLGVVATPTETPTPSGPTGPLAAAPPAASDPGADATATASAAYTATAIASLPSPTPTHTGTAAATSTSTPTASPTWTATTLPTATVTPTSTPPPESTTVVVAEATTVVVGDPSSTLSATDPIQTSLTTTGAGTVSITESSTTAVPSAGYQLLGQQVEISVTSDGEVGSLQNPLTIVFRLDASQLPAGEDASTIVVFRDGVALEACPGGLTPPIPGPCVAARSTLADGDAQITILTPAPSVWMLAVPVATSGVCDEVRRLVANRGIATSLCAKLRQVEAASRAGDRDARARALQAFLREVAAQAGRAIDPAAAERLSALARGL